VNATGVTAPVATTIEALSGIAVVNAPLLLKFTVTGRPAPAPILALACEPSMVP